MKTNLTKLILKDGSFTFGVFKGFIDTEYFTGTDFRAEIVDFYLTIEGKWIADTHEGKKIVNLSAKMIKSLEWDYEMHMKSAKKRGYHSRIKAEKNWKTRMFAAEDIPAFDDDLPF